MRKADYSENTKAFYSPYVVSGNKMYISGQLPIKDSKPEAVQGGIAVQTRQALENMEEHLKKESLTRDSVIMCRIYACNINDWDAINSAYAEFFGDHKPARVVIPVSPLLFGCKLEIEAVAEISK